MFTEVVFVTPQDVRLAVRDWGGPDGGRGIVLVHGLSSNVEIWDAVAPALARNFRVVAYDQRGHGRSSDAADSSFDALAADCAAVAARLRDPVLVGHSWGASVVLHAAAAGDCAGVACVDGGLVDWQRSGRSWDETQRLLTPPHIEGPPEEVLARLKSHSQLPWDAAERVVRRSFVVGEDGVMRRRTPVPEHMTIVRHMWEDRLLDTYAKITCPILLVPARGSQPGAFTSAKEKAVDDVRGANPRVHVEWVDSVHDVPLAAPVELASLIERFASGL
jgi:pimeloyl-ACP methyl ester carboxylesterase